MFGATAVCRDKHRLQPCEPKPCPAETRRIYKSPFLTGLAPQASAREHLRHRSTASDKKPVPVSLPNKKRKPAAAHATLRIAKPQNDKKRRSNNRKQTTIPNPPAPLRRQRIAESTNHADKSRNPCHSGSAVFGCKDSRFRRRLSLSVHFLHGCHHVSRAVGPHIRTPEQTQPRNPRPEHTR